MHFTKLQGNYNGTKTLGNLILVNNPKTLQLKSICIQNMNRDTKIHTQIYHYYHKGFFSS